MLVGARLPPSRVSPGTAPRDVAVVGSTPTQEHRQKVLGEISAQISLGQRQRFPS
jgi:hypothetical protein